MPATAGRVRMPHNNRVSSSSALKMTGIWKDTIGYDPYAAEGEAAAPAENAFEQAQGLMALAKLSNKGLTEQRGACKKCGMVGHLTFQCRNHLQAVPEAGLDDDSSSDTSSDDEDDLSASDAEGNDRRSVAAAGEGRDGGSGGRKSVEKGRESGRKRSRSASESDSDSEREARKRRREKEKRHKEKSRRHSDKDKDKDREERKERKERKRSERKEKERRRHKKDKKKHKKSGKKERRDDD